MVIHLKHTNIILDLNNMCDNINYYFKTFNKKIMAVIKNNAYGHGLKEISEYLDKNNLINYLVVNNIKEALYLRNNNIKKDILVLGKIEASDLPLIKDRNLTITINNIKTYYLLIENDFKGKIHININTGMNRLGIYPFELEKIINSNLNIEGIFTHYIGGEFDLYNIKIQQEKFINTIKKIDYKKYLIHDVSSSSTPLLNLDYTNAIRIGLGLYGLVKNTKPVMSIKSPITNIIKIKKNESVSYHSSFIAPKDGYILTIPFGYGDGWYKNIEILNKDYIQAGDMTMNYTMFYSEKFPKTFEIEILGKYNKIQNISLIHKISPYELITKINPLLLRKVSQK